MNKTAKSLLVIVPVILLIGFFIIKNNSDEAETENDSTFADDLIKTIRLDVDEDDLTTLYERSPFSDERIDGEASFGDEKAPIEFRFRGNSSREFPKKSFNIRFDDRQELLGNKKRLNLNAMWTDPSFLREHVSMQLFRDAGIVAPDTEYYELYINDVYEGLYVHIDRIDKDLLKSFDLNPDGTLIRDRFRQADDIDRPSIFGYDLSPVEDKVAFLEENMKYRGEPDWEAFSELVQWVYNTSEGDDFYEEFDEIFDKENFTTWLAIHIIIGDRDAFGDDYWMYLDHEDENAKWQLIPWDKDLTFGSHYREDYGVVNDFFAYEYEHLPEESWSNTLITKFIRTPELRDELEDKMIELLEDEVSSTAVEDIVKKMSPVIEDHLDKKQKKAFSLHEKNSSGSDILHDEHAELLIDYMDLRTEYLRAQILGNEQSETAYEATVSFADLKEDEAVHLTDVEGWVIASFTAADLPEHDGELTIKVSEDDEQETIDRKWTVETSEPLTGELTLYYRNDIAYHGKENWYKEDIAFESDDNSQWDLQVVQFSEGDEEGEMLKSVVHPFVNKVVVETEINDQDIFIIE